MAKRDYLLQFILKTLAALCIVIIFSVIVGAIWKKIHCLPHYLHMKCIDVQN